MSGPDALRVFCSYRSSDAGAQLTPDRSATLQRPSPSELQLSVSRVGLEHGVGVPANEVQAAVEMRPPDITHEHLGWSRLRGAKVELQALANPNLPLRRFSITLPAAIPRGALRIAIREHERFQRDDAAPEPGIGRRLVYAETFALPAAP